MGNGFSWSASVNPRKNEVLFDLSNVNATLPYSFENVHGEFHLNFNLGRRALAVGDFVQLARSDVPVTCHVEVDAQAKRQLSSEASIGLRNVDRLRVGTSEPILKYASDWNVNERLETDLGVVIVESKLVADVNGILRLKVEKGGFFRSGGVFLTANTDGFVDLYLRARFETAADRRDSQLQTVVYGAVVAIPMLLWALLRRPAHHRHPHPPRYPSHSLK